MAYADYAFYLESYIPVSAMTETEFAAYAERASDYLDMLTSDRVQELFVDGEAPVPVKKAVCGLAEVSKKWQEGGAVTSMSFNTDGYSESRSFAVGVSNIKSKDREMYDTAAQYLRGTGLLSRVMGGAYRCG